ncbi:MAG: carboxylating nicotinate-nucleotide diphosphorylase [Candidatus Omnitrophota bacterium]|nr:MAG: carboxylating nicotinate-nucleotide diphosphorylase [Candidatus Omnitrophota bacterium]HDN86237.1 carboxylating nicotinate-nucleotide diphosphorylase [Candidatus Omnitrophota bacterium]
MTREEKKLAEELIRRALKEDIGKGDLTTSLCVSSSKKSKALILAKDRGVLCGIEIAKKVFKLLDPSLKFRNFKNDGDALTKEDRVAQIIGKATSILTAERTALNFLSLLSGIATYTRKFVDRIKDTKTKIMDTRKTTPTLRVLEKYAVRVGGGFNHRRGLWDGILVKDNHLKASKIVYKRRVNIKRLKQVFSLIRSKTDHKIEIEVESFEEFKKVVFIRPDIVLLDNFNLKAIRKSVEFRNKFFPDIKIEVSGRVNLGNVKKIAKLGVDFISVGSITHSPSSLDFSLEINE